MITFTNPLILLLAIPLLYGIFYLYKHSSVNIGSFRSKAVLTIRIIIILCLLLGLAGITFVKQSNKLCVLFAIDASNSIREISLKYAKWYINNSISNMGSDDQAGVLLFGEDTSLELAPSSNCKIIQFQSQPKTNFTNIARALRMCLGIFPEDAQKRIILFTDGNETLEQSLQEAIIANANGIEISIIPLHPHWETEVLIENLFLPKQIKEGEPFHLRILTRSYSKQKGKLWILRNGIPILTKNVELEEGRQVFTFLDKIAESGFHSYETYLEIDNDTIGANNRFQGFTLVQGKPKVLLIDNDRSQAQYLLSALQKEDLDTELRNASSIPKRLEQLQNYDLLIFNDISSLYLNEYQMKMIQSYVRDLSGGFMMIGGENSFGMGGYYQTPIEETLPVDMNLKFKKFFPSLAMMLVIDKSGSMCGVGGGGQQKIDLAKEAAIQAVSLLTDQDKIGVIAFDGAAKWIVNLTSAKDKKDIIKKISTLRAGGGTNMYPALEQAHNKLVSTDAKIKHIVLLTDGCTTSGDFVNLAQSIVDENITISSVAIGSDADQKLLRQLANIGKGRYYFTNNASQIPRIFSKETIIASRSFLVEEPFIPVYQNSSEIFNGIPLESTPSLFGYVGTSPKETAEVLMVTHRTDPLLAIRQYGLGRSLAFTSDVRSRWASRWLNWESFSKFWQQTARWTLRRSGTSGMQIETNVESSRGILV